MVTQVQFYYISEKEMVRHGNIQIYQVAYELACELRRVDEHNLPQQACRAGGKKKR
jgi:hypothetical protein